MKEYGKVIFYILIVLVVIAAGVTFAFFTSEVGSGEDDTSITSNAGVMNITYNGGSKITATKLLPSDTAFATKVFTVTGTSTTKDLSMKYQVKLVVDNNTFTSPISYTLTSVNTGNNGSVIGTVNETKITGTSAVLGSGSFINAESRIHTYTLKLYYKDTGTDQSADMGANIKVHVEVTAVTGA